jgi:hypothetical protein
MYADLGPVITELRERHSPLTAPPLLHLFVEIVTGYLGDGLDSELLQTIKQQELFVILQALYSEGCDNEASICNRLSLS